MSRLLILVSFVCAMVALVSAAPHYRLVNVQTGHIGTGDINAQNLGRNVVNANNLRLHKILYDINIASHKD